MSGITRTYTVSKNNTKGEPVNYSYTYIRKKYISDNEKIDMFRLLNNNIHTRKDICEIYNISLPTLIKYIGQAKKILELNK